MNDRESYVDVSLNEKQLTLRFLSRSISDCVELDRSKSNIKTIPAHHDLAKLAFRDVAKLNLLNRNSLAGGPIESTYRHAMKIDQRDSC